MHLCEHSFRRLDTYVYRIDTRPKATRTNEVNVYALHKQSRAGWKEPSAKYAKYAIGASLPLASSITRPHADSTTTECMCFASLDRLPKLHFSLLCYFVSLCQSFAQR